MSFNLEQDVYYPVKEEILRSLERYLNNGLMPGSFLTAVLENNLLESAMRADTDNAPNMKNIISYIYFHLPSTAWGSPETVRAWAKEVYKTRVTTNPQTYEDKGEAL